MSSKRTSDDPSFDLPTTREDVSALRRARDLGRPTLCETLEILSRTRRPLGAPERRLETNAGWEPFSLD